MAKITKNQKIANSLSELTTALGFDSGLGVQLSQTATLMKNNRNYFLSNDRVTLSYAYTTHGIIQTLIDQPIEDAFKGGLILKSSELDSDDIQELQNYIKENDLIETYKELGKWVRLYGGGGLVINTIGDANSPLNINQINEKTPLSFYAADLWELHKTSQQQYSEKKPYVKTAFNEEQFFFYGNELHPSRLLKLNGKRAPSFVRPQLRGWGMSEVEKLIRSLNSYLKDQDLVFELLDEAKIDVYGIEGFNEAMATKGGTEKIRNRVQLANQIKNYQNAIVKDKNDDYDQKQMNFGGLSEMLQQIRIGIANDLKMPLTKIFGQSATGFNSGEDDIENYNSMIRSDIRGKMDNLIIQSLKIVCKKLFGFVPDDLQVEYYPLRELNAEQEQNVATSKINNLMALFDRQLISSEKLQEEINLQNLLNVELEEQLTIINSIKPSKKGFINKLFK